MAVVREEPSYSKERHLWLTFGCQIVGRMGPQELEPQGRASLNLGTSQRENGSPRKRIYTVLTCHTTLQDRPRVQEYAVDGRHHALVVDRIYISGLLQKYPGSCAPPPPAPP